MKQFVNDLKVNYPNVKNWRVEQALVDDMERLRVYDADLPPAEAEILAEIDVSYFDSGAREYLVDVVLNKLKEGKASMFWVVDECPDANGHWTIRLADGTPNGDTDEQPIATVFDKDTAEQIVKAHNG